MRYINKINNAAFQKLFLTGNPGQRIVFNLRYLPTQQAWLADFSYGDFTLNGISVVCNANMLHNYHNILPFGICCQTTDGQDPYSINDFNTGYAKLYLLNNDEVQELETDYYDA